MMLLNPYLFSGVTPPAVGEYWPEQGGYYLGIITRPVTGAQFHVVIAEKSAEFTAQWKTAATTTAGMTGLYTSKELTDAQLAADPVAHVAAAQCRAYAAGGFADWSMPGTGEMLKFYTEPNVNPVTGTALWAWGGVQAPENTTYWTSAQGSTTTNGQYVTPGSNVFPQASKTGVRRVRPVRIIPVT